MDKEISLKDRRYLDTLRGISITRVVLVHLGLSWFLTPYSEFIHVLLPILFFVSGGVLFHSFSRAKSISDFMLKRIVSVYVPYLLIVVSAFSVLWAFEGSIPDIDFGNIFQWLTLNAVHVNSTMPFPLNQVWYLHSLIMIIIISPLFFKIGLTNIYYFLIPIGISILISVLQLFYDIGHNMYLYGHNIYQPIVNMGFFFFGAMVYMNRRYFTGNKILYISMGSLLVGVSTGLLLVEDFNMYNHTYAPDLYYLSLSYFSISLFLGGQPFVERIVGSVRILNWFFNFMSRHSYSVFLLHSLVLIKIHTWLQLDNVMNDPVRAAGKIILVLFITCVIAVPFTRLTNIIVSGIISNSSKYRVKIFDFSINRN